MKQLDPISGILFKKTGAVMAAMISFAWENGYAVFQQNAFMEAPALETGQIVGADDKGEIVPGFALAQGIQRPDRVLGRGHRQLNVFEPDLELRMPGNGLGGGVETPLTGRKAMGLLKGILRRDDEIDDIKARLLRQKADNGQMTLVQRIETAGVNGYLHRARKLSTICSASEKAVSRSSLIRMRSNCGA